jgi:YihY family inner membrane protein
MSFWGAIDTAFDRIYELPARGWLKQKRFSFLMLWLVVLFMGATITVPIVQSAIAGVRADLPFGLDGVPGATLVFSLAIGLALLFLTLLAIYSLGPNRRLPWREVWPGAAFATTLIALMDYIYPYYLTNVSSVWRFGTTAVFLVIVLAWFYLIALVILLGAEVNAWRLQRRRSRRAALESDVVVSG